MTRRPSPSLIWHTWEKTLSRNPSDIAFVQAESGANFSFLDLHEWALQLSQKLRPATDAGVAFSLKNQAEWIALFLACQAIGAAAIPLDPHLPADSLPATARSLGAHYLWFNGHLTRISSPDRAKPKTACIKTTSGTTGAMQAVPCRSEHLLADGNNIIATMKIRRSDKNLGLIPLGHSYGLGNLVMPLLLQGNPLVCAGEFVPAQILPWVAKHRIDLFPSVPGVLRIMAGLPGKKLLTPLRTVISAGAPLSEETARTFSLRFGLKIHNFYGSSETGGICYDRTGSASLTGRSVGKPLQGVTVTLSPSGRIKVAGKAVAMPGQHHTLPDLGKWNRYGELSLLARVQTVANIGGKKVAPAEIEELLRKLPAIHDAWVGVIHLKNRDYLAAAVETPQKLADLQKTLHQLLPAWKIPRFLKSLSTLPRTSRGKLDRSALRSLFPE